MLAILILVYLGLVKLFGTSFVVEGGCLVIILAVLLFTVSPGFFTWLYGPEGGVPGPYPVSLVVLAALGVVFVWLGLSVVRDIRNDSRLRRLYEEADIRMIGGPLDGRTLSPTNGGNKWPPDPEVVVHAWVEEENHVVRHIYERTEEGAYHLSRTLPPVQEDG